jgi:hypothetical protein
MAVEAAVGSLAMVSLPARGQDWNGAAIHYGEGVHAYFSGNATRAEQSLSNALALDSQDPRIYYFRALSLLRQGRTAEARGDMQVGATLEAQRPQHYAIGTALERVQGPHRLLLEQYRREARSQAAEYRGSGHQVQPASTPEVLRQRTVIPLGRYLQPGIPQPVSPTMESAVSPRTFAPAQELRPGEPSRRPAGTEADPFGDDPAPAARKSAPIPPPPRAPTSAEVPAAERDDPFEAAASEPAASATEPRPASTTPAEAPAPTDDSDPFSGP